MPIEIAVIADGRDAKRVLGHILPTDPPASLSDFSSGQRELISAFCNPDDDGGLVYVFSNEGFLQTSDYRVVPAEFYTPENLACKLPSGGVYERDVINEARRPGHLVLTHMPIGTVR